MRMPRPATAARRLQDDGEADLLGLAHRVVGVREHARARQEREAELLRARARDVTLSPHFFIASAVGPMNVSPHFLQMSANSAFSDRKP
jgi:hypothetical protein